MDQKRIGKFIRELRESKSLTQEQLAEMIPISREAVSKWERSRTLPDVETILILCKIFDVTSDEILTGERNPKENISLKLYNENNKKNVIIKLFIIIIFILVLAFLSYYFIMQYNKTIVYTINATSDNFDVVNGLLVKTSDKLFFNIGELINKNNLDIENTEIFYLQNEKEKLVYKSEHKNVLIMDYNGYNEYFDFSKLDDIINNIYLKVYYNNTFEKIKLNLVKDYSNNSLLLFNRSNSIDGKKDNIEENSVKVKEIIKKIKNKFKINDDAYIYSYIKNDINYEFNFFESNNTIILTLKNKDDKILEQNFYELDDGAFSYYKYNNENKIEYSFNYYNEFKCTQNNCGTNTDMQKIYDEFIVIFNDIMK